MKREQRVDRWLFAAYCAAVALSVLLVGGATPWLYLPIAVLTFVAAGADTVWPGTGRSVSSLPVLTLASLGVYSAVQAVPVPLSFLEFLAPGSADVWARSLAPVDRVPELASLSLAPGASVFEAVKWISYAGVLALGVRATQRFGVQSSLLVVFVSAVAVAAVTLAHGVVGATSVYGLYEPLTPLNPGDAAPLINPNNLSGHLNLSILIGSGLVLSRRPVTSRWLLGAGLIILLAVSLRTASRGGVASLAVGLLGFGLWATFGRRAKFASARIVAYSTSAALFVGVAFALLGADQRFWPALLSDNVEKLQMPELCWPLIKDHPWFGIGRGAFTSVFFAYRPDSTSNANYTHPENVAVQWVTEWGLIVPSLAILTLLYGVFSIRRAVGRSAVLLGVAFGMGTLLLQNLVDLSLEVPGVAVSFAAAFGCLWGGAARAEHARSTRRLWAERGVLTAAGALSLWVALRAPTTVEEDRAEIRAEIAALARNADHPRSEAVTSRIVTMMGRHPADYYFPLAGAYVARIQQRTPILWIQRALERGPTVGRTHLLLSEFLFARGFTSQALLEMRLALEFEPHLADAASPVMTRYVRTPDQLLLAIPADGRGDLALEAFAPAYQAAGYPALRRSIDAEALRRDPGRFGARTRTAEELLTALEQRSELCAGVERASCIATIDGHGEMLAGRYGDNTTGVTILARLASTQGDDDRALELLRQGCTRPEARLPCLQLLARTLAKRGTSDELSEVLEKAAAVGCMQRAQCASTNSWVGATHLSVGNRQQAVTWFERAARQEPTAARWLELAEVAKAAGLDHVVKQAVNEASTKRDASDPQIAARLEKVSGK